MLAIMTLIMVSVSSLALRYSPTASLCRPSLFCRPTSAIFSNTGDYSQEVDNNESIRASSDVIEKCGPCPLAPKCNGEYREKGCDGSGKIQGGIATIGFMSWWPIKVYRPCPSYQTAGYVYRREGQTLDQVLFSEPSTKMKEKLAERDRQALAATKTQQNIDSDGGIPDAAADLLNKKFGGEEVK